MSIKYLPVGIDHSKPQRLDYTPISIIGWQEDDQLLGYGEKDGLLFAMVERYSSVEEDDEEEDDIISSGLDELFF